MDASERRRLKKLAKRELERRSRELDRKLDREIPVPTTDPRWGAFYKAALARDKERRALRDRLLPEGVLPDLVLAADAERYWDLVAPETVDTPARPLSRDVLYECSQCQDLLNPVAWKHLQCTCGALRSDPKRGHRDAFEVRTAPGHSARKVRITPKGGWQS